jgi:hypothetical protein
MATKKKVETVALRIPPDVLRYVRELSKVSGQSMDACINIILAHKILQDRQLVKEKAK